MTDNYTSMHTGDDSSHKDNFRVAELTDGSFGEIQDLEEKISKNLGKKISLVAYENPSR